MWHEFQLLCSWGYGVVYANPRGSGGYGYEFQRANFQNWGDGPMNDVLAALSLDFEDRSSLEDIEKTVNHLERQIKNSFSEITRVFVEVQAREHHTEDAARAEDEISSQRIDD